MKKLSSILNALVSTGVVWCAVVLMARYALAKLPAIAVASVVSLTVLCVMLVTGLSSSAVVVAAPNARRVRKALLLFSHERRLEFFYNLFCLCAPTTQLQDCFCTEWQGATRLVQDYVRFAPMTADDVAQAWRQAHAPLLLLTDTATAEASELARDVGATVLDFGAIYALMQDYNAYPRTTALQKQSRVRTFVTLLFQKRNIRPYLTGASFLLVTSLWSNLKIYYLCSCIVLCLLAIVCAVLPEGAWTGRKHG